MNKGNPRIFITISGEDAIAQEHLAINLANKFALSNIMGSGVEVIEGYDVNPKDNAVVIKITNDIKDILFNDDITLVFNIDVFSANMITQELLGAERRNAVTMFPMITYNVEKDSSDIVFEGISKWLQS